MGREAWLLAAAAVALALAAVSSAVALRPGLRSVACARVGTWYATAAAALAAVALLFRWWDAEALALHGPFDAALLGVVGISVGTAFLLGAGARRWANPAADDTPLRGGLAAGALGTLVALLSLGLDAEPWYVAPATRSPFAAPHHALSSLGAGLLLAAGAAAMARLADRRKGGDVGESWDRVLRGAVALGLPPFLISVVLGAVWHAGLWSSPWQWELTETWPFAVIALHLAWLHLRTVATPGARGASLLLAAAGLLAGGVFLLGYLPGALGSFY